MSCNLIQLSAVIKAAYAGTDPYFNQVVALLHLDSQADDLSFEDKAGHVFKARASGGVVMVADPLASGGMAAQFSAIDGSSIDGPLYIEDFRLHGDFTMEAFVTPTSYTTVAPIISMGQTFGNTGMIIYINANGMLVASSGNYQYIVGNIQVPLNSRSHVAMTRSNGVMALWVNGQLAGTTNSNLDITDGVLAIGAAHPTEYRFSGKIDEVRVTKAARYTSAFTPSSTPWPDQ